MTSGLLSSSQDGYFSFSSETSHVFLFVDFLRILIINNDINNINIEIIPAPHDIIMRGVNLKLNIGLPSPARK